MGGDLIYNVPRKPYRPKDQVVIYRAQVAHSTRKLPTKTEDPDLPPPASPEEAAGPIVPLPSGGSLLEGEKPTTNGTAIPSAPHDGGVKP